VPPRPRPLPFVGVEALGERPHVVVDGASRPATVLTLSHWPGSTTPPELARDLSTEIALAYLDSPGHWASGAEAVTNDHFDEDGLASCYCLVEPNSAGALASELVAFARGGDFDVVDDEHTLRALLATRALVDPAEGIVERARDLRPGALERTSACYLALIGLLPELLRAPERFEGRYAAELARVERSFALLEQSELTVEPERDLAIVRLVRPLADEGGIDLLALHSATTAARVAVVDGGRVEYHDRYESWVRVVSRAVPRRVDLGPLARRLSAAERDGASWHADPPGALVAYLRPPEESTLEAERVLDELRRHLDEAPPAWDPFASRPLR
jgi:hypothetical protein